MIERDGKTYTAVCDYCGKALAGYMSHASAKQAAKDDGWEIGVIKRKYLNYCPDCAGHYRAERAEG